MKNIAIIGAGPSGSYLAYLLAKKGYKVDVYEEHPVIGKPVQCTGIISKNLKNIVPLGDFVINKVKGAVFFSKHQKLELNTDKVQAYIVDRAKFDQYIAERARKAGANFYLNHRFLESKTVNGKKILKFYYRTKIIEKQADILVGADGPVSRVAKSEKMNGKRKFLAGIQARVKGNFQKDTVQVYAGTICPGFFAWLVPESEKYARLGLASGKNTLNLFKSFVSRFDYKIIDRQSGLIPIYSRVRTQKNKSYLLGDAAMQVKATTGGGIVMGLLAAECLALSIRTKIPYPILWKSRIGLDLLLAKLFRNKLNKFSDNDYDDVLKIMSNRKNLNIAKSKGDMDFPTKYILKLVFREPRILKYLF